MVRLLRDDALVGLAIPVLYNTCVDYGKHRRLLRLCAGSLTAAPEPAQTAAYKAGLNPELVSLLSGPRRETVGPVLELICKLLELIATQGRVNPPRRALPDPGTHLPARRCRT